MNPAELERFREVEEIFYAAIERPAGNEREKLVCERCGADENLRTEVTLLLEDHEHIRAAAPSPPQHLPRFGAWQAVKLLGRGGMGTVYLAERADGAFRMTAAVKVVPLALASHGIEERFRRERQFLAGLDHPKVARLIDGGVSETGLPYLVMEFVGGPTIDQYCDAQQFDTRRRIVLFRQLLGALAYVHGRQVIHRDIKPSNILIDDAGNVKLLDFGTARLVDATAEAALTKTGVFAFTPEYASPEQVRGEPVAAASDLYSAGVLLYRLLTGVLPYRIEDPSPTAAAKAIARARLKTDGLEPPLKLILSKALRKDAAARYQSAADMDADLARYLEGQRVHARKPRQKLRAALGAMLLVSAAWLGLRVSRPGGGAREFKPFDAGVPNARQPALSGDGQWLVFASAGEGGAHAEVWLKKIPNGKPRRVTGGGVPNDEPSLSPDGRWVAFHSTRQPPGIYVQPAEAAEAGGAAMLLIEGGRVPRFSPDGRWIAYLNTSETRGDTSASNMSMLFRMPAQGGAPVQLARNASSIQGYTWSADGRAVLALAIDEAGAIRLWSAPLDGGPAALIPEFSDPPHLDTHACAATGDRFFYTAFAQTSVLGEFLLKPGLGASRYSFAAAPALMELSGCTASANNTVLVDAVDNRSNAWALPIDAARGTARGSPAPLNKLQHGDSLVQFTPDGSSFFVVAGETRLLQDYRTGSRRQLPRTRDLSSDGAFVLREIQPGAVRVPPTLGVLNLQSGESWGSMQTSGVPWDLSNGGRWMIAASADVHRTVIAWDTRTAVHQAIYSERGSNLYLASFSKDGHWVVFTSEQVGQQPRMWAAPFRELRDVPAAEWVSLGDGDYPRWSTDGGRIYFTQVHDGFECIFMRAVDAATKRPTGPVIEVQHFHGRLTPQGTRPGTFRMSVARDKLGFPLGVREHRLWQWQ